MYVLRQLNPASKLSPSAYRETQQKMVIVQQSCLLSDGGPQNVPETEGREEGFPAVHTRATYLTNKTDGRLKSRDISLF